MTDFQRDLEVIVTNMEIANKGSLVFKMSKFKTDTPITELPLDLRSANALRRAKIDTTGELIERIGTLSKVRGVGLTVKKRIHTGLMSWYYDGLKPNEREDFWRETIDATIESAFVTAEDDEAIA